MADRVRVGGSAYTIFKFLGNVVAFAQEVRVASPTPVADHVRVQPLNARRPAEIITAGAHTGGTLTLQLTELYNESFWQRFGGRHKNAQDIVDIMRLEAENDPDALQLIKIVNPPTPGRASMHETYYGCRIVRVADDETINIATMQINKELDIAYTYSTKDWINGGNRLYDLSPNVRGS